MSAKASVNKQFKAFAIAIYISWQTFPLADYSSFGAAAFCRHLL